MDAHITALTLATLCFAPSAWGQPQTITVEQRVTVGPAQATTPPAPSAFGGSYMRARLGPGLEVAHGAVGGWAGAMLGWENRAGLGLALTLGARYHASPSYGVFDAAVGGLFRVSALPAERVHPFGEIGPAVHFVTESAGGATSSGFAFGLDAALGLTIDFTRHLALDLAGRGEILLRGDGPLQVVLTPMAGVAIHL